MSNILDNIQEGLLEKNILLIFGEVKLSMYDEVLKNLSLLETRNSPDIEVRIFTNGGSVDAGLDIYDAVKRYKG